jgi:hypothetical protein
MCSCCFSSVYAQAPSAKYTLSLTSKLTTTLVKEITIITTGLDSFFLQIKHLGIPYQVIQTYPVANLVRLTIPEPAVIARIALLSSVLSIDVGRRNPSLERSVPSFNLAINHVNRVHHYYPYLDGRGQTLSLKENVFDTADIDFKGRFFLNFNTSRELSSHATFMATTIIGAGNSDFTGTGVARGARMTSNNFNILLPSNPIEYVNQAITVENHSYGVGVENYYGAEALAYDVSTRENPALVHVFSAGNRGNEVSDSDRYRGLRGTANFTGNFKMAKNVLVIGALDSAGQVAPLSSRGPAYDGRIKPDLVAYGPDGSSGAAALVSGAALLLQQLYQDQNPGEKPSSALIRALLINGADDLDAPGPDFNGGYGSLNVLRSVEALHKKRYLRQVITSGQTLTLPLDIPVGARELRVALAWNEPPGAAVNTGPNAHAVNQQILLALQLPGTTDLILPWKLDTAKNNLHQLATRGPDLINNFKQISFANPLSGTAQIQLTGRLIGSGKTTDVQEVFVVYDYETTSGISWQFPTAVDFLKAGKNNVLRWQGGDRKTAALSYTVDEGKNWRLIDPQVDLHQKAYNWLAPDTFAQVRFQLKMDTETLVSDSVSLSGVLGLQTGFNCAEDVLLFWRGQPGAKAYQIWGLGGRSLEKTTTTADTFIVIDKNIFPNAYFAVAPVLPNGAMGIRSFAINFNTQGVGCYVKSLLAEPILNQSAIRLDLLLGANFGLAEIFFEKKRGNDFVAFAKVPVQSRLTYTLTDTEIRNGVNTYRAKLILTNRDTVYSPETEVYTLANDHFLLFPNPVSTQGELLFLADQSARFELFDLMGRRQLSLIIPGGLETIPTSTLVPGVYYWITKAPDSKAILANGRIIVVH